MSTASQAVGMMPCPSCGNYYCPRFYGGMCPSMTPIHPAPASHYGCICPPTSEKTCQAPMCPRKPYSVTASGPFATGTEPSVHRDEVAAPQLLSQSVEVRVTGIELHCDDCQHSYAVWFAPNEIWNRVMGGQDCKGDPGGMLCPRCFTLRAEAAGFIPTAWEVRPGVVEVGPTSSGNGGAGD